MCQVMNRHAFVRQTRRGQRTRGNARRERTEEWSGLSSEPGSVTWPPAVGNLPPRDDAPVKCRSAVPILTGLTAVTWPSNGERTCYRRTTAHATPVKCEATAPALTGDTREVTWRGGARTCHERTARAPRPRMAMPWTRPARAERTRHARERCEQRGGAAPVKDGVATPQLTGGGWRAVAVHAAVASAAWHWRTEAWSGLSSEPGSLTRPPAVGDLPPRDDGERRWVVRW